MFFHSPTLRRGVSVMEVLMSIGIVSVGLLGVVALVPVGGHQADRGFMKDFSALYGKSAFRQFELRGMGEPRNWVVFNLNNGAPETFSTATSNRPGVPRPHGYCLDPRFISRHNPTANSAAARFPYTRPSGTDYLASPSFSGSQVPPRPLHRISLDDGVNPASLDPLGKAFADLIFQSNDDLRLDKPDDRTLPPVVWDAAPATASGDSETIPRPWQTFDGTAGLDDQDRRTSRQSEGELSWLATIVPKVEAGGVADDLYILSVVVFENRELVGIIDPSDPTDLGSLDGITERVVVIPDSNGFLGGGFGGGEVVLRPDGGNPPEDLVNDFDDFGAGSWIMLMRNSDFGTIYRWYKVIAADDQIDDSLNARTVTLDGPDWFPATSYPTRAVIVPGVVAVYEKVLRLEGSSLFAL